VIEWFCVWLEGSTRGCQSRSVRGC
jgi:hypothetical protein